MFPGLIGSIFSKAEGVQVIMGRSGTTSWFTDRFPSIEVIPTKQLQSNAIVSLWSVRMGGRGIVRLICQIKLALDWIPSHCFKEAERLIYFHVTLYVVTDFRLPTSLCCFTICRIPISLNDNAHPTVICLILMRKKFLVKRLYT